eukprot:TRINITY_DN27686_c0_g1_i1.p1 TRINITY_DN27686_c0_g1~~TRINITY_DN27686_c0_g1_i1.p1  ORF type:complete len:431 (-),score=53.64 TRINITY_DN27686_c0_g1_i1:114-1406(-)
MPRPLHFALLLILGTTALTCGYLFWSVRETPQTNVLFVEPSPQFNFSLYERLEKGLFTQIRKKKQMQDKLKVIPKQLLLNTSNHHRQQYVFFRLRYGGGLNNQIEEIIWASHFARSIGRGIVLPHMAEQVTWVRPQMDHLFPFHMFFDVNVLSQLLPTLSLEEWRRLCNSSLEADIFPVKKQKIMQQAYETNLNFTWKGAQRISINTSQELAGLELPDCLGVQWPRHLISGALQRQNYPGDPPIGGLVERDKLFELYRRHIVAAPFIVQAVKPFTASLGRYLAIHVRVGDFLLWCNGAKGTKCPTYTDMALQLAATTREHNISQVFVACDPTYMNETLGNLSLHNPKLTFHTFSLQVEPFRSHPDIIGMAEQQICIDAPLFIGNAWSTWTRTVHELRYTSKKKCTSTLMWNSKHPWCINPKAVLPTKKPK